MRVKMKILKPSWKVLSPGKGKSEFIYQMNKINVRYIKIIYNLGKVIKG